MHAHDDTPAPIAQLAHLVSRAWRDLLSVYYSNTPMWRVLKSVGLLFFGFFCWAAANLVLSYRPEWTFLWYLAAYGFVLIIYGPLHHAVILPAVIRLRRTADSAVGQFFAKRGSKLSILIFVLIVLVLGTMPIGVMGLDFGTAIVGDSTPDASADVVCENEGEIVHCTLEEPRGFDHAVVTTGEREIATAEEPPYSFEIRKDELEEVVGQKEFIVELRDAEGDTLRRYRQTVA